ncbi:MAG: nuclear transport factor 2 family protein, partial [Candidatus Eisenbacteria bacterium]|nr:nuclear transport factor 2 family protein [Candidatus Eisenbacteria bacterium]
MKWPYLVVGIVVCLAGVVNAGDNDYCWGEEPQYFLTCLEQAFNSADMDRLSDLYAEDFVSEEYHGKEKKVIGNREETLAQQRRIFDRGTKFEVEFGPVVVDEIEPGKLWRLDASWSNKMTQASGDSITISMDKSFIIVRRVDNPQSHYEMVSWAGV